MSIRSLFLDALYPRRLTCDLCGRETRLAPSGPGAYFCPGCLAKLQPVSPSPEAFGYLDGVQAGLLYNDAAAQLIHAFKYAGAKYLAESLCTFLPRPPAADWIIPVPLHPFRRRQRGYNQSQLLAQRLSRETGIPVQTKALTRIRNTPSQAQRTHAERPGNVRDAFLAGRGPYPAGGRCDHHWLHPGRLRLGAAHGRGGRRVGGNGVYGRGGFGKSIPYTQQLEGSITE